MKYLVLATLFSQLILGQTASFQGVSILPSSGGGNAGYIQLYENAANGTSAVLLYGPISVASSFSLRLPNQGSPGPSGTYSLLCADNSNILVWCAPSGAGSYMDLTTNQSAAGIKTFTSGVSIEASSTARQWVPQTDNTYKNGAVSFRWSEVWGQYIANKAGTIEILNSTGSVSRAGLTQLGFFTNDAAGATVNSMISTGAGVLGFNTTIGYKVNGTTRIDSGGNIDAANLTATGSAILLGGVNAGSAAIQTGGPLIGNSLNVVDLTVTGSATGLVSTTSTQTISGVKTFTGGVAIANNSTARQLVPDADNVYKLADSAHRWTEFWSQYIGSKAGSIEVLNVGGTVVRAAMSQLGFANYDSLGVAVNTMLGTGFNTTAGYSFNGTAGMNLTCPAGWYLQNPVIQGGIITGGNCAP